MYSVNQLVISGCKRQWILMDTETSMPLLYPLSLFKVPPWPF
ncbi:integrase, partial [Citrobacter sp. wls711]